MAKSGAMFWGISNQLSWGQTWGATCNVKLNNGISMGHFS